MGSSASHADVPASSHTTCAVAVLFRPAPGMVERLCASVRGQVARLYVVDNTPSQDSVQFATPTDSDFFHYIALGENAGLAAAQNVGLRLGMQNGFTHILLLDQDSQLNPGTVDGLLQAERQLVANNISVGAVGAMYIDTKSNEPAPAHRYLPFWFTKVRVPQGSPPLETDWLIASGSLLRSSVLQQVGLMREDLFIDVVDTEWGLRARSMGLLSFLVPAVVMLHSIGDDTAKLLGRNLMVHNDLRACYMMRNNAYLLRIGTMGWRWRSNVPLNLLSTFISSSLTAKNRLRRARLLLRALVSGLRGQLGPMVVPTVAQKKP